MGGEGGGPEGTRRDGEGLIGGDNGGEGKQRLEDKDKAVADLEGTVGR